MENKGIKNPVVIVVVLGILVVGGVVFFSQKGPKDGGAEVGQEEKRAVKNPDALETVEGGTREKIKTEVKTPEPTDEAQSEDIAVPKAAIKVGEEKQSAIRIFELRGENEKFSPSTIVVNELDVVEIELNAVDRDYDIFFPDFGVIKTAKKGTTEKIQFQAYPFGEYAFKCKELCKAEGKLIVNPQKN
ncbi:MAG: cupredoxin domain-containing protein [bacterium]|nr:cupredoxin domain-containing protein [bacterium]